MIDWSLAVCRQTDPEIFFPATWAQSIEARRICQKCPIVFQCLEFAMQDPSLQGVWGGLTDRQRQRLRKEKKTA